MATVHQSNIRELSPPPNGSNTIFVTPTEYEAGSFRLVWNGQVYAPADTKFGWAETGSNQIQTVTAPRVGDVLQAYYRDLTGIEVSPTTVIVGSPHAPGEC